MDEQLSLFGNTSESARAGEPPQELADEVAAAWGLPVGRKARVMLRGHPVETLVGWVQLDGLPSLPFDGREALRLRIGRYTFTSRQVAGWSILE